MKLNLPCCRPVFWAPTLAIGFLLVMCPAQADVNISSKPTKNMKCSGGVCTPTKANAILNVAELANMLAAGDVTVRSSSLARNINVNAALSWTSVHGLALESLHDVLFNKPVTVAGTGALTLTTGGSGGDLRFSGKGHVEFWSNMGSGLTINHQAYRLYRSIKDFARDIRHGAGEGQHYALMKNWSLRRSYTGPPLPAFDGTFEGLGNSISHLTIRDGIAGGVGLFESLGHSAVVRDLNLVAVDIAGTASGGQGVGGLAGANISSTVQRVTVAGQISGGPGSIIGGLIGGSGGPVIDCASNVTITGADSAIMGGLIGVNEYTTGGPTASFSTGALSGGGAVGGLVGKSIRQGLISDSFATGMVAGANSAPAGGLIGIRAADGGSVATSYSTGSVSSGAGAPVGGSIGQDQASGGIGNDYWDLDTSGVGNPHQGAGNVPDDPGITGLTDAQLKSGLPAGFDPKVWAINPKINNGYPYLINNPPPK